MVKLSCVSDRNECLRLSSNLPKNINLDKSVPQRYREQYKAFKSRAWMLRTAKNLNTYIGFDRCVLQLKVKKKDDGETKYGWTIHKEFIPKPSSGSTTKKQVEPRAGLIPTQPLSDAETESICIMSGLKNVRDANNIAEEMTGFVHEKDLEAVENIMPSGNGCAILTCKDRESAVNFAKKYHNKQHNGNKITVQIFSPRK